MLHARRVVSIFASLALLQLTLLGSVMPCATPEGDGGTHAEHVQNADAADGADGAIEIVAAHTPAGDIPASPDCAIRACASSPVLIAARDVPPTAVRATASVVILAGEKPVAPLQLLEPPPPRA